MIRPYRPADLEPVKEITSICFAKVSIDANIEAQFGPIGGHDWRWRKLRHLDQDVEGERARGVFVWEEEGRVLGYITTRTDPGNKIGWIPNMAVLPQHQSRGLGRLLMERALDYLRAKGMEAAKIETLAQNAVGAQFYPSAGFREVARQIHYLMHL